MNSEKIGHTPKTPENKREKEEFEPQIIFDYIRHGQAQYGKLLKRKVQELGYNWEDVLPTSQVAEKIESPADLEGKLTPVGKEQIREAIKVLVERIDKDNEVVMVLFGPRFRTIDSSKIILEELERAGINVCKARQHKNLIDTKKHWIAILEFVKTKDADAKRVFPYWLNMSEQEVREADLEGVEDISKRTDNFIKLIERYARRYKNQLGLKSKKLRVIAITHDINIMLLMKKENVSPEEAGIIENAQIVELAIDKKGNRKITI